MDLWHGITNWLDHNRWLVVGVIFTATTAAWTVGCQSTTASPSGSGIDVNWIQLKAEVDSFAARVVAAEADLANQDAIKQKFVSISSGLATAALGGTFNPTQLITSLVTVAGVAGSAGLGLDNRRKNKIITNLKNNGTA
jgi:hypothetical protein